MSTRATVAFVGAVVFAVMTILLRAHRGFAIATALVAAALVLYGGIELMRKANTADRPGDHVR